MLRPRLILPLALVALAGATVAAAVEAARVSSVTDVTVTAGKPHELSFTVSPALITAPTALFKVTNKGKLPHSFKVCTTAATSDKGNSCTGVATAKLAPGQSTSLTVKLPRNGRYEYLSGVSSQAAAGMKGLVTVSLSTSSSSASAGGSAGGSAATTTTTASSSGTKGGIPAGSVVNGQATDPACSPGTLVPVGPGAGDQDDDNEGGFPTDGDGCL